MDMKTKVKDLQGDMGIIEYVECSIEEQKDFNALIKEDKSLPEDVVIMSEVYGDNFYREKYEVAPAEQELYLLLYQTKLLET